MLIYFQKIISKVIKKIKYKNSDTVRVKIIYNDYKQNVSEEVRTICRIYKSSVVTYHVKDSIIIIT